MRGPWKRVTPPATWAPISWATRTERTWPMARATTIRLTTATMADTRSIIPTHALMEEEPITIPTRGRTEWLEECMVPTAARPRPALTIRTQAPLLAELLPTDPMEAGAPPRPIIH